MTGLTELPNLHDAVLREEDGGLQEALGSIFAIVSFTPEGRVLAYNDTFATVMGLEGNEAVGQRHASFCLPGFCQSVEYQEMWTSLAGGEPRSGVVHRLSATGEDVWLRAVYAPVRDAQGTVVKVVKYAMDVTAEQNQLVQARQEAHAVSERFGVICFSPEGVVQSYNDNYAVATGYAPGELVGQHHRVFCPPEVVNSPDYAQWWARLANGESLQGEYLRQTKQGQELWIRAVYAPVRDRNGKVVRVIKYATDITAEKQMTRQLQAALYEVRELSLKDALTGLANRRHFEERFAEVWASAIQHKNPVGLVMVDVDHFKQLNDAAGHQEGDRYLISVANALQASVRREDLAARYGGEEFAVLLTGPSDADMWRIAHRLHCCVRELALPHPGLAPGRTVTASAGVAIADPLEGDKPESLIRIADEALYRAKAQGRDRTVVGQRSGRLAAAS
ncbi:MAG: diguanylate cyclase [Pseudomonadota bacterium]